MALSNKHRFTNKVHVPLGQRNPEECLEMMATIMSEMNRDNTSTIITQSRINAMRHFLDIYEAYNDIIGRMEVKQRKDELDAMRNLFLTFPDIP